MVLKKVSKYHVVSGEPHAVDESGCLRRDVGGVYVEETVRKYDVGLIGELPAGGGQFSVAYLHQARLWQNSLGGGAEPLKSQMSCKAHGVPLVNFWG